LLTEKSGPALEYKEIEKQTNDLLYKGVIPNNIGLEFWYTSSFETMHNIKNQCIDLVLKCANNFGNIPQSIITLQNRSLFDPTQLLNEIIDCEYDIVTWENIPCQYMIETNLKFDEFKNTDFHALRKSNNLKNKIKKNII
jgi:hypothetical protein